MAKSFFEKYKIEVVNISIHDRVAHFSGRPDGHSDKVQDLLASIRTELDAFSAEETLALYRHVYLVPA